MDQDSSYNQLETKIAEIKALDHLTELSGWDESTFMASGSAEDRGEIHAQTAALRHRLITSSEFSDLLEAASEETLTPMQAANLRKAKHESQSLQSIPEDLLKASKRAFSTSTQVWLENRRENNWNDTVKSLEETIAIAIEMSDHLASGFGLEPYDALVNQYELGLSQDMIDPVFDEVKGFLVKHVGLVESQQSQPVEFDEIFDKKQQLELAEDVMQVLRFDFDRGRLDLSAHPFSTGTVNDARITTRIGDSDFTESLFAVIHETGHSRYTQNQPHEWVMQFAGEPTGMAIHESQSLFMEMQIAKSDEFLAYIHPIIKSHLGGSGEEAAWTLENLKSKIRHVKRDFIRVYADEMTYPFHILLRYEIEKSLCRRELSVKDIPDMWNHHMKELLDLDTRDNYENGCMQDIHWYSGLFGYFPCYLVGAVYAAQLYKSCISKIGSQRENLRQGDLSEISNWLAEDIHSKGSLLLGPDLMQEVTGGPLSAEAYLNHLKTRYLPS